MIKQYVLETERTILRNLTIDDAEVFYALNLDPQVVKYTADKPFDSIEAAHSFLLNYKQYEKYRVGRFAVIDKATSRFVGWCGLKFSPDKDEYDIGFRFFREYWNMGYATETAKVCLDYGFNQLGIQRVVGRAMKENIASIKVLKKLGMSFLQSFDFEGNDGVIYELMKLK